ncbi:relaxase/mobilization nuclease domain-containing protein [Thioclava sp. F28-4]|uniref:relaxase/mobilization nuclease domain-containing protein n=1 Tax=Thioclava sp. F28-4 TaxID=1915315 RepID=UPI0011BA54A1|nr:hypothetical protein [Thioclava sp. F28-4]
MRAITKRHSDASFVEHYVLRDGSEPIGGTLVIFGRHDARKQLSQLVDRHGYLHITLSLPQGMRAEDALWLQIVITLLELMDFRPMQVPWIAVRHTDATCDHIHIALALTTLAGKTLKPNLSRRATDHRHQELAKLLGLPAPEYFDPKFPTLRPPTPIRNLKSKAAQITYRALTRVFGANPPLTLDEMVTQLKAGPEPVRFSRMPTKSGHDSYVFLTESGAVRGSELGTAWQPKHLHARIAHAMALSAARLIINLRPIQPQLKELMNAARAEIAETEVTLQSPRRSLEVDRHENRSLDVASGSARLDEAKRIGHWGTDPRSVVADERGAADAPRAPSAARRSGEGASQADDGSVGTAGGARRAAGPDRKKTRPASSHDEASDALTYGAWLTRALAWFSANFSGWTWVGRPEHRAIDIRLGSEVVRLSDGGLEVLKDGPDAQNLADKFQNIGAASASPTPEELDLKPDDCADGLGFG